MIFYKSLLELDGANMISILSFDSRSMESLLGDQHSRHFSDEFPLIYKTKIVKKNNPNKFFYRSAIDNALNKQAFDKRKIPSQVVSTRVFFVHPVVSRQFGRKCRQQITFSSSKRWSKRRVQRKPVDKNTERTDTMGPAGCAEHLNKV